MTPQVTDALGELVCATFLAQAFVLAMDKVDSATLMDCTFLGLRWKLLIPFLPSGQEHTQRLSVQDILSLIRIQVGGH